MDATTQRDDGSVERVKAAAQHVRMLMLREETPDEIESEVRGLVELADDETLTSSFETAIEVLAMAPPAELDRLTALAAERRSLSA